MIDQVTPHHAHRSGGVKAGDRRAIRAQNSCPLVVTRAACRACDAGPRLDRVQPRGVERHEGVGRAAEPVVAAGRGEPVVFVDRARQHLRSNAHFLREFFDAGGCENPAAGDLVGVVGAPPVIVRCAQQAVERAGQPRALVEDCPARQRRSIGVAWAGTSAARGAGHALRSRSRRRSGGRLRRRRCARRRRSRSRTGHRTPACETRTSRRTRTCATVPPRPAAPSPGRVRCWRHGQPATCCPSGR